MSRRTKGVIESTMAGIKVSRVSSKTMFQGAELPGAAPGRRPGSESPDAGAARAQSGAAAANRRTTRPQIRERELLSGKKSKARINFFLFLRHFQRRRIRPPSAPAG